MGGRRIRVLLAISAQDGDDRGVRTVALALRDAGMEVVYAGPHGVMEQVAAVALQECVDVVALVVPAGARLSLDRKFLETLEVLRIRHDLKVAVGGAISARDVSRLRKIGVEGIFPAGTPPGEIVTWLRGLEKKRGRARDGITGNA